MVTYEVIVSGDKKLYIGPTIEIVNSNVNDGTYTVVDVDYDSEADETAIVIGAAIDETDDTGDVRINVGGDGVEPFASHPNEYGEYDGQYTWTVPEEGDVIYSKEDDGLYIYNGYSWTRVDDGPFMDTFEYFDDFTDFAGWNTYAGGNGQEFRVDDYGPSGILLTGGWIAGEADATDSWDYTYANKVELYQPMLCHWKFGTRFIVSGTSYTAKLGWDDIHLRVDDDGTGDVIIGGQPLGFNLSISSDTIYTFKMELFWNDRKIRVWMDGNFVGEKTILTDEYPPADYPEVRIGTSSSVGQDLYVDYVYYYADNRYTVVASGE